MTTSMRFVVDFLNFKTSSIYAAKHVPVLVYRV